MLTRHPSHADGGAYGNFFHSFFLRVFFFSICLRGIAGDARATSGVCAQWAGASRPTAAPLQLTPDARGGAVEVVADEVAKRFVMYVLVLLDVPPHTAVYVSSYCYICVLIRGGKEVCDVCSCLTRCASSYCNICVLMLLYMCPHTRWERVL